jgi:hypothetical protein
MNASHKCRGDEIAYCAPKQGVGTLPVDGNFAHEALAALTKIKPALYEG